MQTPISDEQCTACESADLESTGPGTYRCRSCGYDGGSGQAAKREAEEKKVIAGWSVERKRTELVRELTEARLLLLSALGSFEGASELSQLDLVGIGGQHTVDHDLNDKQKMVYRSLGEVEEARHHLKRLRLLSDSSITLEASQPEDIHMEFDQFLDNILSDLRVHRKIAEGIEHTKELLHKVDSVLADYGSPPEDGFDPG